MRQGAVIMFVPAVHLVTSFLVPPPKGTGGKNTASPIVPWGDGIHANHCPPCCSAPPYGPRCPSRQRGKKAARRTLHDCCGSIIPCRRAAYQTKNGVFSSFCENTVLYCTAFGQLVWQSPTQKTGLLHWQTGNAGV